ncbi:LAMI_0G02476g1_1 [Lachancea mirantina]|uniref:LAMI_0G02476g1_1 n=1 Tax=Lachancea mirantina TaxID=1230905 RepID=A0A1G4K7T1_9SACH|nr:LAMI_0G02476g1_1 [Lachancea mirantina]
MNTRTPIVEYKDVTGARFLNVNFNQDYTCFSCSSQTGFLIYNADPLDCKLSKQFSNANACGIGLTCMLYRTNYLALVGGGRRPKYPQNKLVVWDDLQQTESITLGFMSQIQDIFLSRVNIIVVLDSAIEIYTFGSKPRRLVSLLDTCAGASADFVVCQSPRRRSSSANAPAGSDATVMRGILAFPSGRNPGQVQIADLSHLQSSEIQEDTSVQLPTSIIKAHKTPIRRIKLSPNGNMVATCSVQGTIVRIFSTQNGTLLKELRRGLDRADIYEMAWSLRGNRLAVVSDKQTLHIFQISDDDGDNKNKTHMLKDVPLLWKPKYLASTWSMCSRHLDSAVRGKNDINDKAFNNDRCKIGWCHDGEEDSLVLVWRDSGIWEKYVMLERENKVYTVSESLPTGSPPQSGAPKKRWEVVRASWRQL